MKSGSQGICGDAGLGAGHAASGDWLMAAHVNVFLIMSLHVSYNYYLEFSFKMSFISTNLAFNSNKALILRKKI